MIVITVRNSDVNISSGGGDSIEIEHFYSALKEN